MATKMKLSDQLRLLMIEHSFEVKSLSEDWDLRAKFFLDKLGATPWKRDEIIELGSCLSEAFQLIGKGNRGQGSVSSGGKCWELLLVWFLNLCLHSTDTVCLAGLKKFIPSPISKAISVTYDNARLNTETDIILISSKHLSELSEPLNQKALMERINTITAENYSSFGIVNIQCKTNWNDNAQIPMLWNMLYNQARRGAIVKDGFSIGSGTYSLSGLGDFVYAFATVPTQRNYETTYKQSSTAVLRAKTMSGGNYWGHPSKNGVAQSIAEIFQVFQRNSDIYPPVEEVGEYAKNNPDYIKKVYFKS